MAWGKSEEEKAAEQAEQQRRAAAEAHRRAAAAQHHLAAEYAASPIGATAVRGVVLGIYLFRNAQLNPV